MYDRKIYNKSIFRNNLKEESVMKEKNYNANEVAPKPNGGGNGGGGGGCYITTATCEQYGKADDCYELTQFRKFRDTWLINQPDGKELIKKYYDTAPFVVELINKQKNSKDIYDYINEKYLNKCLHFIEQGENEKCKSLYIDMMEFLYNEQIKWQ